ncbi:unnamed protein product, partial [Iphiclides podalirius]
MFSGGLHKGDMIMKALGGEGWYALQEYSELLAQRHIMLDYRMQGPKFQVKFIRTTNGNRLALFRSYTYCKHYVVRDGARWKCSRQFSKSCNAYLLINDQGAILKANELHTHEPFKYHCNLDGTYVRI